MTFTPPHKALVLWRVYTAVVLIWLLIICGFMGFVLPVTATAVLFILFISAGAFICFYYLPKLKDSMKIKLTPDAVIYCRGVFICRKYIMPMPRMIYAEHFNTPVSAAMGLANLRLRAARGRLTVFSLSESDAAYIAHATGNDFGGGENG